MSSKTITRIYACSDPHCRTVIERRDPVQRTWRCPACGKIMFSRISQMNFKFCRTKMNFAP